MDVTCARCGTEYEFEDTLLAPTGTPVRCGECGHAFRVAPPHTVAAGWRVRRDDGLHLNIASLTELRERIRRGEIAEHDEISRPGEAYKRLADIAELRSTFDAARTARRPLPQPVEKRRNYEVTARQGMAAARTRNPNSPISEPPTLPPPGAPADLPLRLPRPPAVPVVKPRPTLQLALDDVPPARRRRSMTPYLALLVAIGGAAGAYALLRAHGDALEREVATSLGEFDDAMSDDTYESYRSTCTALADLHRESPDDSAPLAAVARCEARWSDALTDEASVESDTPRAASLRGLAAEHHAEAQRFAAGAAERTLDERTRTLVDVIGGRPVGAVGGNVDADLFNARLTFDRDHDAAALGRTLDELVSRAPRDARMRAARLALAIRGRDVGAIDRLAGELRAEVPSHPILVHADRALRVLREDAGVP